MMIKKLKLQLQIKDETLLFQSEETDQLNHPHGMRRHHNLSVGIRLRFSLRKSAGLHGIQYAFSQILIKESGRISAYDIPKNFLEKYVKRFNWYAQNSERRKLESVSIRHTAI